MINTARLKKIIAELREMSGNYRCSNDYRVMEASWDLQKVVDDIDLPWFCPHRYQYGDGVYLPYGQACDGCVRNDAPRRT